LLMAIERDDLQIVRMLLKAGADPNGPSGSWGSLLNAALYKGQLAIIKALVDSGANTRIITRSFGGPLHILNFSEAFASDDSGLSQIRQIAHLLLGNGAQLDARDHGGGTPIMRAIFHGNMPYAELLLELGADVNTRDELG
ncbi:ankyrin, partial [Westerdykella ornata]